MRLRRLPGSLFIATLSVTTLLASARAEAFTFTPRLVKATTTAMSPSSGGGPGNLVAAGGTLFFVAPLNSGSSEFLWKSDGTTAGTMTVTTPSVPGELTAFGSDVVFASSPGTLWKSDGTAAGTILLSSTADPNWDYPLEVAGGKVYFQGRNSIEISVSDGTAAGTQQLSTAAYGGGFTAVASGAVVFFSTVTAGKGLWRTDGTPAGTVAVKSLTHFSGPVAVNGVAYFAVSNTSAVELWKTDGTVSGTVLVKGGFTDASSLVAMGGRLYFWGQTSASGRELWTSDGTTAGTSLVTDIVPGSGDAFPLDSPLVVMGSNLYFTALASGAPYPGTLYRSDGTAAHTVPVLDSAHFSQIQGAESLVAVNDTLFFRATDCVPNCTVAKSIFATDGTAAGTLDVANAFAHQYSVGGGQFVSQPDNLTAVGGTLFFRGDDGTHGYQLWAIDAPPPVTPPTPDAGPTKGDGGTSTDGGSAKDGGTSGTDSGAGGNGSADDGGENGDDSGTDASPGAASGCSTARAPTTTGTPSAAILMLMGLAAVMRRRRSA